jgi:hypothetical protein
VRVDTIKSSFLELDTTRLIDLKRANDVLSGGTAVQVDSVNTRVESAAGFSHQRSKLQYDETLSKCAFKFKLRHYSEAERRAAGRPVGRSFLPLADSPDLRPLVGRCRLTPG